MLVYLSIKLPADTISSITPDRVVFCSAVVRGRDVSRKTKTVSSTDPKNSYSIGWLEAGLFFSGPFQSQAGWHDCHIIHSFFITVELKRYKIAIRCSRLRNPQPKPILTVSYCVWSCPKSRSRGHMTKGNDKDECDSKQVSTQTQIYFPLFSVDC